jgi:hypothetical protein
LSSHLSGEVVYVRRFSLSYVSIRYSMIAPVCDNQQVALTLNMWYVTYLEDFDPSIWVGDGWRATIGVDRYVRFDFQPITNIFDRVRNTKLLEK